MLQPLHKIVEQFLKILKVELPYQSANPLLRIHLSEIKPYIQTKTCIQMFRVALCTIAPKWKQFKFYQLTNAWRKYSKSIQQNVKWKKHNNNNGLLIHVTTWTYFGNIMQSETKTSHEMPHIVYIHLIWYNKNRQIFGYGK